MANILEQFIQNIRGLSQKSPEELREIAASQERKEAVNARSGDNIRFYDGTELSDNYKNTLMDAIKFYQDEFKVTPHATIANDPDFLDRRYGSAVEGLADLVSDSFGQYGVDLKNLKQSQEEAATLSAQEATKNEWSPKNSGDISMVPIHELGHVLYGTLFPYKDTSSNSARNTTYQNEKYHLSEYEPYYLVRDALKDIGIDYEGDRSDENREKATKAVGEVSRYAATQNDPGDIQKAEVIAESLVDYYYNRDEAAPLSKAIVNRLKSAGSMYGIKQTGGFDLDSSADNFMRNLRRYKVIQ